MINMKKDPGKIALSAARGAIDRLRTTGPPNVSVEDARRILGPDLSRMIRQGWLDDDICEALSDDQNESDLRRLLDEARRAERRQRRARKRARAEASPKPPTFDIQRLDLAEHQLRGQALGETPMLTTHPPAAPSLALPAPPAQVGKGIVPASGQPGLLPPAGTPRPVTRNRGVRRPQQEE